MTNNRVPFIGSGRSQEGGALATRKQDFNAHWQGNGFRHDATNIDMNPAIPIIGGSTVQETLEKLYLLVISSGTGFLSIGDVDGYIEGDYNVGSTATPTLAETFNAAFADARLQAGGIILLLAGTYHLRSTVTIPPGISLIGEIGGTTIVGEMSEIPMFIVSKPDTSINLTTGVSFDTGSNVDKVVFSNLVLIDNLDGYATLGEPSMTTVPMIQAQVSSNFTCENVSFIGKLHSGAIPRSKTQAAIGSIGSGSTGTILKMKNCYFDGLRIGLSFTPNNNDKDFLTVEGCKARIYGTEDVGAQSTSLNSFIVTNHCNLSINNNYFVGIGNYTNTFINIIAGSGANTKSVISNNSGKPAVLVNGKIIVEDPGSAYAAVITGNNWGITSIDSPWYIVVGDGSSSLGDFNGSGAINTILSIATSISDFEATVIVNSGNYSVSGSHGGNFANLSFIGQKHGRNYPVLTLSLPSGVADNLGNRPLTLGNRLQSLQFISGTARHSVRPGFNPLTISTQNAARTMEVMDCIFINTSLYALDLSTKPWTDEDGNAAATNIVVKDCYFLQDGSFSDTVSMLLPNADEVKVENCFFTGNGYAFSIGKNGYTAINASIVSNVYLSNVICDLTGYTISAKNSSLAQSYILVDNAAVLKIDNCQIYNNNEYVSVASINTTLTSSNLFNKFIHLKVSNINIEDSLFVGPHQTFTSSSIAYAMPTLYLEPLHSARIRNSKIFAGSLPLQFSGSTILSDGDFRENLIVENCYFNSQCQTVIDFDLNLASENATVPIAIKNCNITNGPTAQRILHVNTTLTENGVVQIFGGDCYVNFTDNIINGSLTSVTGSTNYAGLIVNNYDDAADQSNSTIITGNTFYITNNFTSASAAASSSCILCRSVMMLIQNNLLTLYNAAAPSASFIGPLVIDNPAVAAGSCSSSIVSNNIFARRNFIGTTGSLVRGYIQVTSTSAANRGMIIDNSFDSTTINGSSTTLVEDNTTFPNIWTIERNKNQTKSSIMLWSVGSKGIASGVDLGNVVMYGGAVSTSSIIALSSAFNSLTFSYKHTGNENQFRWSIPLQHILPSNVIVTSVTFKYQASAVPGTTKVVFADIIGVDGTDSVSSTISGTSLVSNSITLSSDYTTGPTDSLYLIIGANINHSANLTIAISDVYVTYHW